MTAFIECPHGDNTTWIAADLIESFHETWGYGKDYYVVVTMNSGTEYKFDMKASDLIDLLNQAGQ